MKNATAAVVAAAAAALAVPAASAATFLGSYEGHDYYITDGKDTVHNARAAAVNLGGMLVTINDAAEDAWLEERIGNQKLFIGLSDEVSEGVFLWDNGDAVTYTNWAHNEPNDHGSGEDFALINWNNKGEWNDIQGNAKYKAIIEVVPTPGSAAIASLGLAAVARRRR